MSTTSGIAHLEEAVVIHERAGNLASTAATLGNLGYLELSIGRTEVGRAHLAEAVSVLREMSDWFEIAYAAFNLGLAEFLVGDLAGARRLFTEAVSIAQDRGIKPVAIEGSTVSPKRCTPPMWT